MSNSSKGYSVTCRVCPPSDGSVLSPPPVKVIVSPGKLVPRLMVVTFSTSSKGYSVTCQFGLKSDGGVLSPAPAKVMSSANLVLRRMIKIFHPAQSKKILSYPSTSDPPQADFHNPRAVTEFLSPSICYGMHA